MLETLALPFVALVSFGWSLISAARGNRAVAVGAAVMSTVLGVASAAHALPVMAWLEGGYGMNVIALTGSYALGCAAAFLVSRSPGAKWAALLTSGATALLCGFFYLQGLQELEEVLRQVVDPRDAELIRGGSRAELLRVIELGGTLISATALVLVIKRPSALTPTLSPMGEREEV